MNELPRPVGADAPPVAAFWTIARHHPPAAPTGELGSAESSPVGAAGGESMFEVQVVAREMVKAVKPIMDRVKDGETKDQLKRASISVVLNIAEGNARKGKDRLNRFATAEGSARESVEAVWIAIGWGFVTEDEAKELLVLLDRVTAMLVRLRFPRPKVS